MRQGPPLLGTSPQGTINGENRPLLPSTPALRAALFESVPDLDSSHLAGLVDESPQDEMRRLQMTRSMPSMAVFASTAMHGPAAAETTDRYTLAEGRKLDILQRYDPQVAFTADQIRSKYAMRGARTWRAANLGRVKVNRVLATATSPSQQQLELQRIEKGRGSLLDPSRGRYRWILLLFCAFISVGVWVQFDAVGATADALKNTTGTAPIQLTEGQLSLFDMLYSVPNIGMAVAGGIIVDKLGLRPSILLFCGIVFVSSFMFNAGLMTGTFWLMAGARTTFGLGGESLFIAQDACTSYWFEGRDMALALALTTVVGRLGDVATFAGFGPLAEASSLYMAWWLVSIVCGVSLVAALVTVWMDKRAEVYSQVDAVPDQVKEEFSFVQIRSFPPAYWVVALLVALFYSSLVPFQNLAQQLIEDRYHVGGDATGWYVSSISMVAIVVSPLLGLSLDRWGFRVYAAQVGCFCMMTAYMMLLVPSKIITPLPSLVLLGVSFSVLPAALLPSLVFLVPSHLFGTAYGIMEGLVNAGDVAMFFGLSSLIATKDYFSCIVVLFCLSAAGLLLTIVWLVLDQRSGGWCNLPTAVSVKPNEAEIPTVKE